LAALGGAVEPANATDNEQAPNLLDALTPRHRFVLDDTAYLDPAVRRHRAQHQRTLVAMRRGANPLPDDSVAVHRIFHELRSRAIENFNGQFTGIFDCARPVPTRRYALGAVAVYQLALLYRFQTCGSLRVGLMPLLQAA
jgi:hypothetical protein